MKQYRGLIISSPKHDFTVCFTYWCTFNENSSFQAQWSRKEPAIFPFLDIHLWMFDVMTQEGTTDHVVEQEERIFF